MEKTIKVLFTGANQYVPVLNLKTPIAHPIVLSESIYKELLSKGYTMEVVSPISIEKKEVIVETVVETVVAETIVEEPVVAETIVEEPVVAETIVEEPVVETPVAHKVGVKKKVTFTK